VQARITAYDEDDPAVEATASTKISVLMNAEPPPAAALQAGGRYTQRYRFYNQDRLGTPHTYTVTHTATPGLFESVTHPATVAIPAGSWGDVDVAFTLPAGSAGQIGALGIQLQDVDPHWSERIGRALGAVSAIEVLPPSIQLPDGWRHGSRGQAYSVRLVATNNTAGPRTLCFSSERAPGSGGNADNVTTGNPAVPPCQPFGAHETRTLPITRTVSGWRIRTGSPPVWPATRSSRASTRRQRWRSPPGRGVKWPSRSPSRPDRPVVPARSPFN
jgi:hypothetical protein